MVDAPPWLEAEQFALPVGEEELLDVAEGEGDVLDFCVSFCGGGICLISQGNAYFEAAGILVSGFELGDLDECDSVVLVVVGHEGELVGHRDLRAAAEEGVVELVHLGEVVCSENDMG